MAINTFDPKYHSTSFVNLHAARTAKPGEGKGITMQPFETLLGGSYTEVAKTSQVERDVAQAPTPQLGLWGPRFKV